MRALHSHHASERLRGLVTLNTFFDNADDGQRQDLDAVIGELAERLSDESADVVNATLTLLTTLTRRFTETVQPLLQSVFPALCRKLSATIISRRQKELLDNLVSVLVSQTAYEILLPMITDMMTSDDVHILIPCLQLYQKCLKERRSFFVEHHRIIPHILRIVPLVRFSNASVSSLAKSLVQALYENSSDAFVSAVVAQSTDVFKRFREILQPIIPTFEEDLQRRNMSSGRFVAINEPVKEVEPIPEPQPVLIAQSKPEHQEKVVLKPTGVVDPTPKASSGVPEIDRTLNSLKLGVETSTPQIVACFKSMLDLLRTSHSCPFIGEDLSQVVHLSCKFSSSDNKELCGLALDVLKELVQLKIDDKHIQTIVLTFASLQRRVQGEYDSDLEETLSTFQESFLERDPQTFVRVLVKILQDPTTLEVDQAFSLDALRLFSVRADTMYLTVNAASIVCAVSPLLSSRSANARKKAYLCVDTLRNSMGDVFAPFLRLLTPKQLEWLDKCGKDEALQPPSPPLPQPLLQQQRINLDKPQSKPVEVRIPTPPQKQPKTNKDAVALMMEVMPSPIQPRRRSVSDGLPPDDLSDDVVEDHKEESSHSDFSSSSSSSSSSKDDGTDERSGESRSGNDDDDDASIGAPPSESRESDSSGDFCPSPPSDSSDY